MAKRTKKPPTSLTDIYAEWLDQVARLSRDKNDARLNKVLELMELAARIKAQTKADLAIKFMMGFGARMEDEHPIQKSLHQDMDFILASLNG